MNDGASITPRRRWNVTLIVVLFAVLGGGLAYRLPIGGHNREGRSHTSVFGGDKSPPTMEQFRQEQIRQGGNADVIISVAVYKPLPGLPCMALAKGGLSRVGKEARIYIDTVNPLTYKREDIYIPVEPGIRVELGDDTLMGESLVHDLRSQGVEIAPEYGKYAWQVRSPQSIVVPSGPLTSQSCAGIRLRGFTVEGESDARKDGHPVLANP